MNELSSPIIGTFAHWPLLDAVFLGNTGHDYFVAILLFVAGLIALKVTQYLILNRLADFSRRTKTDLDDTFIEIVRSVHPPFYAFVAFYIALQVLYVHPLLETTLNTILLIWVVYQVINAVQRLIDYAVRRSVTYETEEAARSAARFISGLSKWILWVLGILLVLSNLGVNVTSILAGLGIGGVAVAFALQNILGDLFSSFAIYFDKPFIVGDVIKVGDFIGEVQKIGIKTTRVKALQGEEVIFSNNQLTSDVVQNFGRIQERRSVFTLGVEYDTAQEKLERIPEIIESIITEKENTSFDRSHFTEFGESALEIETSFYILHSDYKKYMDVLQSVKLDIRQRLNDEGVGFAYPTQTIHVKKDDTS